MALKACMYTHTTMLTKKFDLICTYALAFIYVINNYIGGFSGCE